MPPNSCTVGEARTFLRRLNIMHYRIALVRIANIIVGLIVIRDGVRRPALIY